MTRQVSAHNRHCGKRGRDVLTLAVLAAVIGPLSANEAEARPRLVLQAYLLRPYAACLIPSEPGWDMLGGGYEFGAVAGGCSFAPGWGVAVGTKIIDQFARLFEEGGTSQFPLRLFVVNYGGSLPMRTRLAYANVDVQPRWSGNDGHAAFCVGVAQTFYGLTAGAELRWQMPSYYLPYSRLALGVTLGLGGWFVL